MRITAVCLLVLSLALSTMECTAGQTYMKFTKYSTYYANEETWEIYDGSTKIYTSPVLANSQYRIIETCLSSSTNDQYTLKLKDSYGDSWSAGSVLFVDGLYGNVMFKGYLTDNNEETYTLSLYTPVKKQDQWKLTSGTISGTWTEYNYADATWSQVTLGSVTTEVSGPQYFRKTFTGLPNLAAYELSMYYRYGIVAYINGIEIYRDNLPDGPITSSSIAIGSYPTLDYHAILRPAREVKETQSILAIELHFLAAGQTTVDFDAYLSISASSVASANDKCVIYPYPTSLTASGGNNIGNIFDFNKTTIYSAPSSMFPVTITLSINGPKPYLTGLRIWPYTNTISAPNTFSLQGGFSLTNWNNILSVTNAVYTSNTYSIYNGYFTPKLYSNYRMILTNSAAGYSILSYEVQPLICSVDLPESITFDKTTYTFYSKYDSVNIHPLLNEYTSCSINPTPSEGLSFDENTCTLSGVVNTASSVTYTVTSTMNGQQYSGSFQLQIVECTGTVMTAHRVYQNNAANEAFTIKDATTQQVILEVNTNSGEVNYSEAKTVVCLTGSKYTVTVGSTLNYWQPLSFLYINAMLDGENDYETVLRAKFDNYLGLPTTQTFNMQYAIKPFESWYYKMGEVPSNWFNSETSGWQSASAGTFPASTNQIQLYKKTFNVASLNDVAGVVVSLKYQYGVIIYLNGHEAFRKGFTGDLSTSTYSSTSLSNVNFRQISLPIKTFGSTETPSVDYITTGTNTIAIGLIAAGPAQTASTFDCGVRLMGTASTSRIWKVTPSSWAIQGSYTNFFDFYYGYAINAYASTNYIQFSFDDDRHEWISSIVVQLYYSQSNQQPKQFIFKAKNAEDSDWITIKTITGLTWSLTGQSNRIWIPNNKAYNMYRFENFATGDPKETGWKVGRLDLRSDATTVNPPALSYTESIEIYKDIEMGEVYPNTDFYYDFSISPSLPEGVSIDPHTGTISGTAHQIVTAQTYTISAKKFSGETVTASFSLSVLVCTGGKSLITLVARADNNPTESSYKVYQGKGTTGQVVAQSDYLRAPNALNYGDFCLQHGIYTLELKDTSNGWNNPAGYYLTVDVGAMKYEMGQVYKNGASPVSITTMFSSYLPFQIEYDDWKVYSGVENVPANWNSVDYDDSTWTITKAANIGTSEAITVYLRREVNIPDVNDYHVLNIRVKYAGGVVAYFNGRKVARFNLIEDFDANTQSIEVHDSNTFSQFHIVLSTVGAVTGKNVMAFEIHRPNEQSSSEDVVFDATGVFGVNDCSIGVDSIIDVTGTQSTSIGDLENFFDLTPVTYGYQPNEVGTFLQWTVENLEGTKFNSFALQTSYRRTGWGFSLYGRENAFEDDDPEPEEYDLLYEGLNLETAERGRASWSVPVGIAGFRQFRWEVDSVASNTIYISAYMLQYCKPSGEGSCPAVGEFPAVGEGEISPADCEYGYRGYSYRECSNGQLGDIKTDKCSYKVPVKMSYDADRYTLVMNTQVNIQPPTYTNLITKFYLAENTVLPNGLTLDETTGAIEGSATEEKGIQEYTIYGENPVGVTSTTINLSVRKGECKAEGIFPKTTVGETAIYECSSGGNYVGTQKRACLLGVKDGEWQKVEGTCVSVPTIILYCIIGLVAIVIVVFIVLRTTRKAKAVGGVKGKSMKSTKAGASKKTLDKKPSAKTIKV